jgi:hypothetical protein
VKQSDFAWIETDSHFPRSWPPIFRRRRCERSKPTPKERPFITRFSSAVSPGIALELPSSMMFAPKKMSCVPRLARPVPVIPFLCLACASSQAGGSSTTAIHLTAEQHTARALEAIHNNSPRASLWREPGALHRLVVPCSRDLRGIKPSGVYGAFLDSNEKARQQWELERRFVVFKFGY